MENGSDEDAFVTSLEQTKVDSRVTYPCSKSIVNQFHGSEAVDDLSFSIRVDGKFTDEFKKQIPKHEFNPASTAALWACLEARKE